MQEKHETKKRREFLKDGLRVLMLGGFAAVGLSLGRKRRSLPRDGSSCLIDLPCRSCSELPLCPLPRAVGTKQKSRDSRYHFKINKEV